MMGVKKGIVRVHEYGQVTRFSCIGDVVFQGYDRGKVLACCRGYIKYYKRYKWYYLEDWECIQRGK